MTGNNHTTDHSTHDAIFTDLRTHPDVHIAYIGEAIARIGADNIPDDVVADPDLHIQKKQPYAFEVHGLGVEAVSDDLLKAYADDGGTVYWPDYDTDNCPDWATPEREASQ